MKSPRLPITAATVVYALFSASAAMAIQPDAPFLALAEKNRQKWMAEDQQIDAKLASLQTRFGKRPNIIYTLAEDISEWQLTSLS